MWVYSGVECIGRGKMRKGHVSALFSGSRSRESSPFCIASLHVILEGEFLHDTASVS